MKVVMCSTAQAGTDPYSLVADLGADVIKIQISIIGDNSWSQSILLGYPSTFFETKNRGVKSLTLNLKDARALEILYKLVEEAAIFDQNFRPGVLEQMGLAMKICVRSIPI